MRWEKIPYWFRGGLILETIYIIIGIISFVLGKNCTNDFGCLIYVVPLIFPAFLIPSFNSLVGSEGLKFLPVLIITNMIIIFPIGCLIGWIIGKIKSKK